MKTLIQITTVCFFLVQTIGYGQTEGAATTGTNEETVLKNSNTETEIDIEKFQSFIGTYLLIEADFTLEIVLENSLMYVVSPFSKDILIQKNETTLREPTRGVDLERIVDNDNDLKFTQNGYETVIIRVDATTEK